MLWRGKKGQLRELYFRDPGAGLDFLTISLRKIDGVLAAHYGFTDEELDFIPSARAQDRPFD